MLYNKEFGKLNNQVLEYAPLNAEVKGTWYCPAPEKILRDLGFKKIIDTPAPDDGKEYAMSWVEKAKTIEKKWTKIPDPTPAQKREVAYQTEKICRYGDGLYTVDYMNKLWYEYSAEGNTVKVAEIQDIIAAAKADIRERYPDE